ncbi:MAG: hypothetical protein NZ750_10575 [Anaerolineae bacterium]|nr:hypothetical protein [Anaerolineae bacterium]MDW8173858.1 hypothetical protein [Anaerolineae bacterium]
MSRSTSASPDLERRSRPLWQGLALSAALTLLCALVNAAYGLVVERQIVLSEGPVLYAAGFDGFEDEWQTYEGRLAARIEDGALRIEVGQVDTVAYSVAEPSFGDAQVEVTARAVAGPLDNGFGLVFRLQAPRQGCAMPAPLLCELARVDAFGVLLRLIFRPQSQQASGYYVFLISSDGYYSVWRADGLGQAPRRMSTWIDSPLIRQGLGESNRLRVVMDGERFRFAINGQDVPLCLPDDPQGQSTYSGGQCIGGTLQPELRDARWPVGQVGLAAYSTVSGGPGVVVVFDDLLVLPLLREGAPA